MAERVFTEFVSGELNSSRIYSVNSRSDVIPSCKLRYPGVYIFTFTNLTANDEITTYWEGDCWDGWREQKNYVAVAGTPIIIVEQFFGWDNEFFKIVHTGTATIFSGIWHTSADYVIAGNPLSQGGTNLLPGVS